MKKKTTKINLSSIKDSDGWAELCWNLGIVKNINEDELSDEEINKEYDKQNKIITSIFEYGEYANLEIIVDEDLNIVGGKIIPFKEWKK